jgi:hypothetical protein
MRQSFTAVLERNTTFTGTFATEPYEVAWAGEARWFVRALDISAEASATFTVQVSPDGLRWCDIGDEAHRVEERGVSSWSTSCFGGWLRLRGEVEGKSDDASIKVLLYLTLKE